MEFCSSFKTASSLEEMRRILKTRLICKFSKCIGISKVCMGHCLVLFYRLHHEVKPAFHRSWFPLTAMSWPTLRLLSCALDVVSSFLCLWASHTTLFESASIPSVNSSWFPVLTRGDTSSFAFLSSILQEAECRT